MRGFGPVPPGVIREQLISYDAAGRSLTYVAVEGMPSSITRAANSWSVHPRGAASCVVRVRATLTLHPVLRPFGPLLRWRMSRDSAAVFEELRYRLEQEPPPSQGRRVGGADDTGRGRPYSALIAASKQGWIGW